LVKKFPGSCPAGETFRTRIDVNFAVEELAIGLLRYSSPNYDTPET